MRSGSTRFLPLLAVVALAAACSSSGESGPQQTVREFYEHLNGGDYAEAMSLYSSDTLEQLQDPSLTADSGFADWAKMETKNGTVDRVEILEENLGEGTASVEFEVFYDDGSSNRHTVSLTIEDGQWKLGFIT